MKKTLSFCLFALSTIALSQSKTATTEDGKKVILKSDKTWEYDNNSTISENDCILDANYKEPKGKNTMTLRMTNSTTDDLKKHVAVDNECKIQDIKILNISEQKGNAMYLLCVKGKKMKYKRMGSVFMKADQDPFKP
jgi:choline kinase